MLGRLALQCKQPLGNILRGMSTGSAGDHGPVYKGIIATLETALEPTELRLVDDSAKHAGHAAMKDAAEKQGQAVRESHFRLEVVSQRFEGLSRVKRHQMVYSLLDDYFKAGLHALNIQAKTPSESAK